MTSLSRSTSSPSRSDRVLRVVTCGSAAVCGTIVVLVVAFLLRESWPAIVRLGAWRFVSDESWHPLSDRYNLLPMVAATLLITGGAILLAAPIGIASAIFSCFYAPPWLSLVYRRLIELLAGIPSVVYGVWGLVVLVPWLARWGGSGQSLLAATLVLALIILPTIAVTAHAAFASVPARLIAAGTALGLTRWSITRRIALPAARGGVATGLLLAVARAIGETMAVLMLAGNVPRMPSSLLSPVRTLTSNIALEMGYATSAHRSVLFVSGLVLMMMVAVMVTAAEWFGRRQDAT